MKRLKSRSVNFIFPQRTVKIIFTCSLILTSVFSSKAEKNETESSYQVSSLSDDGQNKITLDISIDASGNAVVSKKETQAGPNDIVYQHLLGDNITVTMFQYPDSAILSVDSIPPGRSVYWIPIGLDDPPIANSGSVTFYCIGSKCDENSSCDLSIMMSQPNIANVCCVNTCDGPCTKVSGWSGFGKTNYNGGAYIVASSVTDN